MSAKTAATIAQLTQCQTKAEVVNGELVMLAPTGFVPGRASGEMYASLRAYEGQYGTGCHPGYCGLSGRSAPSTVM